MDSFDGVLPFCPTFLRMRMVCVLAAVVLVVAGCASPSPIPRFTPTDAAPPLFATDAEALAAAAAAYEAYIAVIDEIGRQGGKGAAQLEAVSSGQALEGHLSAMASLDERTLEMVGKTQISRVSLQSYAATDDIVRVVLHTCLDVTQVQLIDEMGSNVVLSTRPDRVSFEVVVRGGSSAALKITEATMKEGEIFCD